MGAGVRLLCFRDGFGRGRGFVDNLEAGWDKKDGGVGLVAIDFGDGDELGSGAGVVVLDEHVDGEVGGVPVIVVDGDGLAGLASGGLDGAGFANALHLDAADELGSEVLVGDAGGGVGLVGVGGGNAALREDDLAGEAGGGGGEDAEAGGGIVDVAGDEGREAFVGGGDEVAALVVDAATGIAGDVVDGGAGDGGSVGEELGGDDVNRGGKGRAGDGGDEDAGNADLGTAVVGRHLGAGARRGLREGEGGGCDEEEDRTHGLHGCLALRG